MKVSFFFFVSSEGPQVTYLDTICRCTSFWPRCLLGVKKMKFVIWPPLLPKNVKIGTFSWQSVENCSHPNSGTVSHVQLQLDTGIDHRGGITWHDSKVKRSKVKVTSASFSGRRGANMRTNPQRVRHKMVAMATPVA